MTQIQSVQQNRTLGRGGGVAKHDKADKPLGLSSNIVVPEQQWTPLIPEAAHPEQVLFLPWKTAHAHPKFHIQAKAGKTRWRSRQDECGVSTEVVMRGMGVNYALQMVLTHRSVHSIKLDQSR